jgi:hypothetical protein
LTRDLGFVDGSLGRPAYSLETWRAERGILDALGVTHVLSDTELDLEGFHLEEKVNRRPLYRNVSAVPAAYAVYRWKVIPDATERLAYLKSASFAPGKEAVIERDLPMGAPATALDTRWLGTEREPQRTIARAELASDALMVFRTAYYPRWKALVDGRPAEVLPVDHAFCGVPVSAGLHEVVLYYDASIHTLAQRVASAAWLLVLVAGIFPLWRRARK